jgi:hypothetical protein
MEFLITTIVAVILLVGVVSSCPTTCMCGPTPPTHGGGFLVNCAKKELDRIPTDFPNVTSLL